MLPLGAPESVPGLLAALVAGLLSFLSPCVLPLIPGYLSFISGYGLADIREGKARSRLFFRSLAFTAGFSLVFMVLGLVFSGGALAFSGASRTITLVSGIVIALLGLNLLFDFLKVLNLEARFHPDRAPRGLGGAFVLGLAFGAGWSPCVGPMLASILLLASREGELLRSVVLLATYSAGLALPFLAAGLFFDRLSPLMTWFKKRAKAVRIVSGLLLLVIGLAMALGRLTLVNSLAAQAGYALQEASTRNPDGTSLVFAGLWLLLAALPLLAALARRRRPGIAGIVVAASFLVLAGLEAAGVLSSARIIASWLFFQGA